VRELENAIKAALVVARGSVMRLEFLPDHIHKAAPPGSTEVPPPKRQTGDSPVEEARSVAEKLASKPALLGRLHETATAMVECEMIRVCLERSRGQLAPAAKMLGISRTTLRKKIEHYRIRTTTSADIDT
jgi:DNA-binding NtrC family response regulator